MSAPQIADLISRKQERGPDQPDFGIWVNKFKALLNKQYLNARDNQQPTLAQEFVILLWAIYTTAITDSPSMDGILQELARKRSTFTALITNILTTNQIIKETIGDFLTGLPGWRQTLRGETGSDIVYNDILETTLTKMQFTFNTSTKPTPQQKNHGN